MLLMVRFQLKNINSYFSDIYPIFPNNLRFYPLATSQSYNSGVVKDTYRLFAPNRGFWGSANRRCHSNFSRTDPCCHGNHFALELP